MRNQISIPSFVRPEEIARKDSLGKAMELGAEAGGYSFDKRLLSLLGADKGQASRWLSGTEGIIWPRLSAFMDVVGNDVPVLWMMHQRGYDIHSFRKRESETEMKLRLLQEHAEKVEQENALLKSLISGK